MSDWIKVDDTVQDIDEEPWSLYWREWKSGTEEFETFLHEPLRVLTEQIEGCGNDWRVNTEIINHENGLVSTAVCTMVQVMPDLKTAKVTLYKH